MTECTLITKKGMVKKVLNPTPNKMQVALRAIRLAKDETVELLITGGKHVKQS